MKLQAIAMVLAAALTLSACANQGPKQTGGSLLGAGLGALAGSQIGDGRGQLAATAIGAVLGAWLGGEVGKSLDEADRLSAGNTTQAALERNQTGMTSTWSNPDSGNSGSVTPTRTYQTADGENCREFETTINVSGQEEVAYGTACRDADGVWRVRG